MGSSSERLPSFKGPRDLSLASRAGAGTNKPSSSGTQPSGQARPRRVFTPNIPPKRDRTNPTAGPSNSSSSSTQQSSTATGRGKSQRGRGARGGKAGKQRGELVQADSIFSDGVGDPMEARRSAAMQYRSGYGGSRYKSATEGGSSRISSLNRSTLNTLIKEEEDEESNKKLFGREFDEPTEEEETSLDSPNVPVVLPLSSYVPEFFTVPSTMEDFSTVTIEDPIPGTSSGSSEPSLSLINIKQEKVDAEETSIPKIKQEIPDDDDGPSQNERLQTLSVEPTAFANVFRRTPKDGTLVFFQFPNELPVLEGSVREPTDAAQCSNKTAAELVRDIDDLPEGFVGRLQIMSSGRTRFVIGENSFDVDPGRPVGFRQELLAADVDNKTLTNLGLVKNKFVLTPDVEYLLRDAF